MVRDLRLAARRLFKSPLFTAFAVLSLAVGVTLTTAVYAILNATLWQRPPLEDSDQLMTLTASGSWLPSRAVSLADMKVYLATQQSLAASAFALTRGDYVPIADGGAAVTTMPVSGAYFQILGVQPMHGRVLGPDDDRPSATPAVLLISARKVRQPFPRLTPVLITRRPEWSGLRLASSQWERTIATRWPTNDLGIR